MLSRRNLVVKDIGSEESVFRVVSGIKAAAASGIFKIVFLRAQKKKGSILYRRNREKTFFRLFLKACCFPAAPGAKTRPCAAGGTWRKFFVSASVF